MKNETFEDFLQDRFWREEPQTLDDMFPDAYIEWLQSQDIEDIISWAQIWGDKLK